MVVRRAFLLGVCALILLTANAAFADTFTFTAGTVVSLMNAQGAPLANGTSQWGLWAVRVMPVVGGSGLFTITGGTTNQPGWGVSAPSGYPWAAPYGSNSAWFWDASGSESPGTPANPLYMIMSQPATTFESYAFDASGNFLGTCTSSAQAGCNLVTAVNLSSTFTVNFTLGPGANWNGLFQFVVDGSRYTNGTQTVPGVWQENFFGGYNFGNPGGGLAGNMGRGYVSPEPGTLALFASGLAGIAGIIRRKLRKT